MPAPQPMFASRGVSEAAEVDAFVARLRAQVAELMSQQRACAATLAEKDEKLDQAQAELERARVALAQRDAEASVLSRTFVAAQRAADEMLAKTSAEAEAVLVAARLEADSLVRSAQAEGASLITAAQAEGASLITAAHAEAAAFIAAAYAEAAHAPEPPPAPEPPAPPAAPVQLECYRRIDLTVAPATPAPGPRPHMSPTDADPVDEPWRLETAIQRAVERAVERVPIAPA